MLCEGLNATATNSINLEQTEKKNHGKRKMFYDIQMKPIINSQKPRGFDNESFIKIPIFNYKNGCPILVIF